MDKQTKNGAGAKNSNTPQHKTNGNAIAQNTPSEQLRDKNPNVQPKPETIKELSVDDKIRKVELLYDSIEKRTLLKSHLARVEALKFGEFEEKDSLTINAQGGGSYVIKSTSLIKEISVLVKLRIEEQIKLVEEQINF